MRSIRAVSRYSRLVGVLSVVAGGSRRSRRAYAPIDARSVKQSAKVADDAARRRAPRLFLVLLLSVGYFVVVSFVVRGPRAAETGERPANQSRSPSARGFGSRATERFRRSPPALVSSLLVPE
jgi:hypothetical protein